MVQILQPNVPTSTYRQQALDQALGNIISGFQGMEETKRQQALRDEQRARQDDALKLQLVQMGVSPEQGIKELRQGREVISPAQEAQAATFGAELPGPTMPGQGPLRQILSEAVPAKEAVLAPSAFEPFFKAKENERLIKAEDAARARQLQEEQLKQLQQKTEGIPLERQRIEADIAKQRALTQKALAETKKVSSEGTGKQLSAADVAKFQEGNTIPTMLGDVKSVIDQNKDMFGPLSGRIAAINPYDERGQTIESSIRTASQAFGRFMEGGVLRKEDEDKYRKMFPNLSDTPQVAENKLQIVNKLLIDKQKGTLGALKKSGFNIQGIEKDFAAGELPSVLTNQNRNQGMIPEAQAGGMPWQKYGAKK